MKKRGMAGCRHRGEPLVVCALRGASAVRGHGIRRDAPEGSKDDVDVPGLAARTCQTPCHVHVEELDEQDADPKMFPVLAKDGRLFASGETRQAAIRIFTAFSGDSHNVVLHNAGFRDAKAHGGGVFSIDVGETRRALRPLRAGDFLVLRDTRRPAPGVWLCRAHDTVLEDCTVHAGDEFLVDYVRVYDIAE